MSYCKLYIIILLAGCHWTELRKELLPCLQLTTEYNTIRTSYNGISTKLFVKIQIKYFSTNKPE